MKACLKNRPRPYNLWIFSLLLFVFLFCLPKISFGAKTPPPKFPRLANYYLRWNISNQEAEKLSKWDLVIIGAEAQVNNPQIFEIMRRNNPDIIILAYIPSSEVPLKLANINPKNPLYQLYWKVHRSNWWLYDHNGDYVVFWPNTRMVNVTNKAPLVSGLRWNTYLPKFVHNKIFSTGLWDGVFYDNVWSDISWLNSGDIDINRDGKRDNPSWLDSKWKEGMTTILSHSHSLDPDKIILGNGGDVFYPYLNGRLYEDFLSSLGPGWQGTLNQYQTMLGRAQVPRISIINHGGSAKSYKRMRFGLTTALLNNGYYSFDRAPSTHDQIWWYDEYNTNLGMPQGASFRYSNGVWRRDYRYGIVLVNPTSSRKTLNLGGEFYKIKGSQDPKYNDGSLATSVSLSAKDGIILFRSKSIITASGPEGGPHIRSFNTKGNPTPTNFFSYHPNFPGGVRVATGDVDGDGVDEIVTGAGPGGSAHVRVFEKNGAWTGLDFWPFGPDFLGGVDVACGDVDGDGIDEIAMSQFSQGQAWIKVYKFNNQRTILGEWNAYGNFEGGAQVALGDVDGDGKAEVITGAGQGGSPHVRVFEANGQWKGLDFWPFHLNFKGGVDVSANNTDNDGKDEIAMSQRSNGEAWIKVYKYNIQRTILGEWRAYPQGVECGANIDMFDIDQDNKAEVITGAGQKGGPHIRAFEANGQAKSLSFFAYDENFRGGVSAVGGNF